MKYYAKEFIPHQEFEYENHITDVLSSAFKSENKIATPIQKLSEEYGFSSCEEIEACQFVTMIAQYVAIYGGKKERSDKNMVFRVDMMENLSKEWKICFF